MAIPHYRAGSASLHSAKRHKPSVGDGASTLHHVQVVAHRAGNSVEAAARAVGRVDMVELDAHVLRGQVELRHEKVLHPTRRLWERWELLPRGTRGVPIGQVLDVLGETPLMVDLKVFTRRSAARVLASLPDGPPIVASTRSWWTLKPFVARPNTTLLQSCGTAWQLWFALHRSTFDANRGVCVHERRLTPAVLDSLHERTEIIYTWGATTTARCRQLLDAGVTGIILDDYSIAP